MYDSQTRLLSLSDQPWPSGKMRNVKLASADRFHIRQRGPDKVFDTGILGCAYRSGCLDDFVGEFAMLGRIASQSAYFELIAGLKSAYYGASLLPRCADYGDEFLI